MKLTLNKILIGLGGISIFVIYGIHLSLITSGKESFVPENFRDIIITTIGVILAFIYTYLYIKGKKHEFLFLIFSNMFLVIAAIHLLRLLFGGLPC